METKHTTLYEAPMAEVMELKSEGIICQSTAGIQDYNWNNVAQE